MPNKWVISDVVLKKFSLVLSSPGGPGMANGSKLPQNAMQHHDSYVEIFDAKTKIALTGVRSRVRESLAP